MFETRKNIFYFTSKALFVFVILKFRNGQFRNLKFHDVMKYVNMKQIHFTE